MKSILGRFTTMVKQERAVQPSVSSSSVSGISALLRKAAASGGSAFQVGEATLVEKVEVDGVGSAVPSRENSGKESAEDSRRYTIGDAVAHGGMGTILHARDLNLRRSVAMKVILPEKEDAESYRLRFLQEAQLTAQLEHPNIVPVHELGKDEQGHPFYTMKFVKGITLHDVLEKIKAGDSEVLAIFSLAHLLTIFQKVCDAVAFAHSRGVVHRDLKPENIMLGDYGEVLVMDWGLAKVINGANVQHSTFNVQRSTPNSTGDHPASSIQHPESGLTMSGQILGSPQFMSPEQAEGKVEEIDQRSDIFALGGILYNILTLQPPVTGESVIEIIEKIRTGQIVPPTRFCARSSGVRSKALQRGLKQSPAEQDEQTALKRSTTNLPHLPAGRIPDSLSAVCMKALALKPEDRYRTVLELQRDVEAFQGGFATGAEQAGALKLIWLLIKRHKAIFIVSHAALLVLLVAGVTFTVRVTAEKRRALNALADLRGTAPTFAQQAQALIKAHDFAAALEKIDYAIRLAPESADYHAMRGNILQSLLRFGEAEKAYAAAIHRDKTQPYAEESMRLGRRIIEQNKGRAELLPNSLSDLQAAMRQQGRMDEAVAMAMRSQQYNAQAYETWKSVLLKSGLIPPAEIDRRYTMDQSGMITLGLEYLNPKSLVPLKGMPIRSLNLNMDHKRQCPEDLEPLRGAPLEWLSLTGNPYLTDVSPLQSMPLRWLNLSGCVILADITPLRGSPLEELNLSHTQVHDISALQGMPLQVLDLTATRVSDINSLRGMKLQWLSLMQTPVKDISALKGMPLSKLYLERCVNLHDLTPLAECKQLEFLSISEHCKDIEFLRALPKLKVLTYEYHVEKPAAEFWKEYDAKK